MSTPIAVTSTLLALIAALTHAKQQYLQETRMAEDLGLPHPATWCARIEQLFMNSYGPHVTALGLSHDLQTLRALINLTVPSECLTTAAERLPKLYLFDTSLSMGNGAIIRKPGTFWQVRVSMVGGCGYRWQGDALNRAHAEEQARCSAKKNLPLLDVFRVEQVIPPRNATSLLASPSARYIVAERWDHIFADGKRTIRFVFEDQSGRYFLRHLELLVGENSWCPSNGLERLDVIDSLLHGNPDALAFPEAFELTVQNTLPDWAT